MEENSLMLELELDQTASKHLIDIARWAKFIAVFVFAAMACLLLVLILARNNISYRISNLFPGFTEGFGLVLGVAIFVAIILSIVFFFLLRAANLIKRGVETKDQQLLTDGLRSLKIYFTIYGAFAIMGLVFNLLALL